VAPPAGWYTDPSDSAGLRWWDGQQWTTATRQLAPAPPTGPAILVPTQTSTTAVRADPHGCQVCGAGPARATKFRSVRGMIVLFVWRTHCGRWCRDCAEAKFREAQNFTLAWGWWGFFTLFFTPVVVGMNLYENSKAQGLAAPTNRRAAPLPKGGDLFHRPGIWIALVGLPLAFIVFGLGHWPS
jgi:hypothetical protein